MIVNIIKTYRNVVAVCDEDLLGKVFEEGEFQLDVKESFFGEKIRNKEETIQTMQNMSKEDSTFNIIGKESIQCAIDAGILTKNQKGEIANIPFALILR